MHSWLVVLPPIIVIVLATVTRKISWSIFAGITAGLLILHDFSLPIAAQDFGMRLWKTVELDTLLAGDIFSVTYIYICLFLLVLTVIVTMLGHSGGAHAYGNFVMKYLKRSEQAERASLLLSLFFCIDDYFSSLAVGSVMQPVTDRFKIARVKLALLVNGMAAPLALIFPISSWVAEIMMQMRQSGIGPECGAGVLVQADLLPLYFSIIPFLFYAVFAIVALWLLVLMRCSYGLLLKHEDIAERTGNLFAGKMPLNKRFANMSKDIIAKQPALVDFLLPMTLLFSTVFAAILYFGDWSVFGGQATLFVALQKGKIAVALFWGSCITLFVSMVFLLARKKLKWRQIPGIMREGVMLMLPSVVTLVLLWTLSSLLKGDLATGKYLASLFVDSVNLASLPAVFFLFAALTATAMGSVWGSIGIYVPIAVPMLITLSGVVVPTTIGISPLLVPLLGGIISGSLVGNHLSPISDTMLMSSTSTGTYHSDLVRVQFAFTVPIVAAAVLSFLIAGWMVSNGYGLGVTALTGIVVGLACVVIQFKLYSLWSKRKTI
jgi:Na+/H+ antiporter NhaC